MSDIEVDYLDQSGTKLTTLVFKEGTSDEEINDYVTKYGEEIEISAGVREPGFGPVTMGAVPESFERGLYSARQIGATLGAELGLLDKETAAKDIEKMENK